MALRVDEEYSWESSQNQVLTHLQFIINSFSNDFGIAVVSSVLNLVQLDPPHLVIVHPNFLIWIWSWLLWESYPYSKWKGSCRQHWFVIIDRLEVIHGSIATSRRICECCLGGFGWTRPRSSGLEPFLFLPALFKLCWLALVDWVVLSGWDYS